MADSERGWTFEELDEEERKMAAYEQLLAAKEAEEAAWVERAAASLRETSDATSFGRSDPAAERPAADDDDAADAAADAADDTSEEAEAELARARVAHGGGTRALTFWRAAVAPHGLGVELAGGGLGRQLVAARPFRAGEVVLRAAPAAIALDVECASTLCATCLRPPSAGAELRRCSGCQLAHYCSEAHQRIAWAKLGHAAECRLIQASRPRVPTRSMRLAAIGAHGACKPTATAAAAAACATPALLSLQPRDGSADRSDGDVRAVALLLARLLHAAGVQHAPKPDLLAALLARLRANAHSLTDGQLQPIGAGLFPLAALSNHSCDPSTSATFEFVRPEPAMPPPSRAGADADARADACLLYNLTLPTKRIV